MKSFHEGVNTPALDTSRQGLPSDLSQPPLQSWVEETIQSNTFLEKAIHLCLLWGRCHSSFFPGLVMSKSAGVSVSVKKTEGLTFPYPPETSWIFSDKTLS